MTLAHPLWLLLGVVAAAAFLWFAHVASRTASLSSVSGATTPAALENATIPSRVPSGTASTNARTAAAAASDRDGATSVARIEPDVSTHSTTATPRIGSVATKRGDASAAPSATIPTAHASAMSNAGFQRVPVAVSKNARSL